MSEKTHAAFGGNDIARKPEGLPALVLVRHSKPLVASGLCYGRQDVPVDAQACRHDAARLRQLVTADTVVFSSPQRRSLALASALARAGGAHRVKLPGLQEIDFGRWEGRSWDDIPRVELDAWAADFLHARPHGGESVAQLQQRVEAAFATIRAMQAPRCLVVTHGGVLRVLLASGGAAGAASARLAPVPHGGALSLWPAATFTSARSGGSNGATARSLNPCPYGATSSSFRPSPIFQSRRQPF